MPTYNDPVADAEEAREAVRALAHASRAFADPADTYVVTSELLGTMRSLEQVLAQVAAGHVAHQTRAFLDNGDHRAGITESVAAAAALRRAASLAGQIERALDEASQHSARIAWHPAPPATTEAAPAGPTRDPFAPRSATVGPGPSL